MSEEGDAPKARDERYCDQVKSSCKDNECNNALSAQDAVDEPAADAEGTEEAEAAEEEEIRFETAPFDPRFPNTNQTKHCFTSFVDYKRCIKLRGEDFPPCEYYKRVYTSMCPNAWIEKWERQLEEGTFTPPI